MLDCVYVTASIQANACTLPRHKGDATLTVKEIAELAGVSIGTVDRVLHGRGRVSAETREKVEAIVRDSGYAPNPIARHLKLNKGYTFRVLGPKSAEDSGYWGIAYRGIAEAQKELSPFGITIELCEFDRYESGAFTLAAERAVRGADALLIAPVRPDEITAFISRIQIPYAFFDANLPGSHPLASISQDAFAAGFLAGRLLRLFAGVDGDFLAVSAHAEDYHIAERKRGFESFFRHRCPMSTISRIDVDTLEIRSAIRVLTKRILSGESMPRGIFVTSASAHLLASSLREAGIKKEIALVAFDLVKDNAQELELGGIDALISQRPQFQVRTALEALHRHVIMGDKPTPPVSVALDVFFRENIPVDPVREEDF